MKTEQNDMLLEITKNTAFAPGIRWHARQLLENKDPTGGMVSLNAQLAEIMILLSIKSRIFVYSVRPAELSQAERAMYHVMQLGRCTYGGQR